MLVDANFRPWLLEVNVAPSLSSSSPYDKMVKTMLLSDSMHLAGFQVFDRQKYSEQRKIEKRNMPPGPFTKIVDKPTKKESDLELSQIETLIKQRMNSMTT